MFSLLDSFGTRHPAWQVGRAVLEWLVLLSKASRAPFFPTPHSVMSHWELEIDYGKEFMSQE